MTAHTHIDITEALERWIKEDKAEFERVAEEYYKSGRAYFKVRDKLAAWGIVLTPENRDRAMSLLWEMSDAKKKKESEKNTH